MRLLSSTRAWVRRLVSPFRRFGPFRPLTASQKKPPRYVRILDIKIFVDMRIQNV